MRIGGGTPERGFRVCDIILRGSEPPPLRIIAFAASLPIFGRICEVFGRKLLYLLDYALFSVVPLHSGFAPNRAWLVPFRIVRTIGGALLNLMRVLGPSLGVASASSMLSRRIQVRMGVDSSAVLFIPYQLLDALERSFVMLAIFALIAGVASDVGSPGPVGR